MRWVWVLLGAWMAPCALHAEMRGMPVSALKHVSATALDGRVGGVRGMAAAAPYPEQPVTFGKEGPVEPPQAGATVRVSMTMVTTSMTLVPVLDREACGRALRLVVDVATTAYGDTPRKEYMALIAQAVLIDDVVRSQGYPDLGGFRRALGGLPWFGPLRSNVQTAGTAVLGRCQAVGGSMVREKSPVGSGVSWPE